MRLFVAVVPPAEVLGDLDDFLAPRRDAAPFRWTPPVQWHLTLAFMGSVADHRLDDLFERLQAAASRRTPFGLRVTRGGAFPDPARARVLYAALTTRHASELGRLAAGARTAAATSGCRVDGARFRPHLTLARLGAATEVSGWVRLLDAYRGPEWVVEEVTLVASHLGEGPRRGPRYETLETFALR